MLDEWLKAVEETELAVDGTVNEIALANCWSFSATVEEVETLKSQEVEAFILAVFQVYQKKLSAFSRLMWFYTWFDEQAGQLRFSAAPVQDIDDLPFGCRLNVVRSPKLVCRNFLQSRHLEGIPLEQLEDITDSELSTAGALSQYLTVFAREI